jgi:hypothetical protein
MQAVEEDGIAFIVRQYGNIGRTLKEISGVIGVIGEQAMVTL